MRAATSLPLAARGVPKIRFQVRTGTIGDTASAVNIDLSATEEMPRMGAVHCMDSRERNPASARAAEAKQWFVHRSNWTSRAEENAHRQERPTEREADKGGGRMTMSAERGGRETAVSGMRTVHV